MRRIWIIVGVTTACVLIFIGRLTEYIISEYVTCSHVYEHFCSQCSNHSRIHSVRIPQRIHQIFFYETSDTLPVKLQAARETWLAAHLGYQHTLWNKTSVEQLLSAHYPHLQELYRGYDHWVKRADVARYVVLHHHGGWYVDMDVACKQSLGPLEEVAASLNRSVIVRYTEPWGFSNDFIGISPAHPFLGDVLRALPRSNGWYVFPYASTMFSTGPMFMWGRYLNYPHQDEFHALTNETYFRYLELLHSSSWHSWDGKVVWFLFQDVRVFIYLLCLLAAVAALLCYCCRRARGFRKLTQS